MLAGGRASGRNVSFDFGVLRLRAMVTLPLPAMALLPISVTLPLPLTDKSLAPATT